MGASAASSTARHFHSLSDFYRRVGPTKAEAQILLAPMPSTASATHAQRNSGISSNSPTGRATATRACSLARPTGPLRVPAVALTEPGHVDRLRDEQELLGFTVSGHPLDLFPSIPWERYCPIAELGKHLGQRVKVCGLTFADRIAYQENGQPMKFVSLCDYTGFVETELSPSSIAPSAWRRSSRRLSRSRES